MAAREYIDDAAAHSGDDTSDGGSDDSSEEHAENVEDLVDDTPLENAVAPSEAAFEQASHGALNFMVRASSGSARSRLHFIHRLPARPAGDLALWGGREGGAVPADGAARRTAGNR